VLHSMQKAAHLEDVSEGGCWAELRERSSVSRQRPKRSMLLAVHSQGSLGSAHAQIDFITFLFPSAIKVPKLASAFTHAFMHV